MNLFKGFLLFVVLILFISISPIKEKVLKNKVSIDIQLATEEKEIYIIQGSIPFDYELNNHLDLLHVVLPNVSTLDLTKIAKQNNLSQLETRLSESKKATLTFHLKEYPYFFSRYYFSYKTLIIELNKHPKNRLYKKTIVVDPGHGAYSDEKELWDYYDCGVIGSTGIYESEINLKIAKLVQKGLEENGATVILTRDSEKNRNSLRFAQRGLLVNDIKPDLFISIHQNGSIDTSIRGTVIYYSNPTAKKLAEFLEKEMIRSTPFSFRYLFNGKFELIESMKISTKTLIECAFLSNPMDEKLLLAEANQEKIASAIVSGIINFFENS